MQRADLKINMTLRTALMLIILSFVVYGPTLRMGFLFNDHTILGPGMETGWNLTALVRDLFSNYSSPYVGSPYYRPLITVINRLDHTLGGGQPWVFHLTNLLLHVATVLVLLEFLLAINVSRGAAFIASAIFAVHPLPMDLFFVVTTRGEIMGLLFSLLALRLFAGKSTQITTASAFLAFVLALLSYESAVIVPVLVALVFWRQERPRGDYKVLIAMALVLLFYLAVRQSVVGPISNASIQHIGKFFAVAFPRAIWMYAILFFIPYGYRYPREIFSMSPLWPLYIALLFTLAFWLFFRRKRNGLFWLGWAVVVLLPKTPAMIEQSFLMEHWSYALLPAIVVPIAQRLESKKWAMYLLFVGVVFSAWVVRSNIDRRGTDDAAYRWSIFLDDIPSVRYEYSVYLISKGRALEAITYLEKLNHDDPDNSNYGNALAIAYASQGEREKGIKLLEELEKKDPANTVTVNNLKLMRDSSVNSLR
jgi:hypothetical protein